MSVSVTQAKDFLYNTGRGYFKNLGTFTYTDFSAAAQSKVIILSSALGEYYSRCVLYPNQSFAGTGITAANMVVTLNGSGFFNINMIDPIVPATNYQFRAGRAGYRTASASGLRLILTVNAGKLTSDLNQGSVTLWAWVEKIV